MASEKGWLLKHYRKPCIKSQINMVTFLNELSVILTNSKKVCNAINCTINYVLISWMITKSHGILYDWVFKKLSKSLFFADIMLTNSYLPYSLVQYLSDNSENGINGLFDP